jgi:peptidoglycan/xylan/chitin deacetylase (PgdA/CDA1 family)
MEKGSFIISLDFELHWGIFDSIPLSEYKTNLENVNEVIHRLLEIGRRYNIKYTFASVGFLFADSKEKLLKIKPKIEPNYSDSKLNSYSLFENIGEREEDDNIHYASNLLKLIIKEKKHEVSSHTFSHYYCLEAGQTAEDFEEDTIASQEAARLLETSFTSIVFPKNQVNDAYLGICKRHGIVVYRGSEKSSIYNQNSFINNSIFKPFARVLRLIDSYINLTGFNTYKVNTFRENGIINLPSSRFLRPFNSKLRIFENLKLRRILKSMRYAAKNNEIYHLWWHPHNFGSDIEQNFKNLEILLREYSKLNKSNNFSSVTMSSFISKID